MSEDTWFVLIMLVVALLWINFLDWVTRRRRPRTGKPASEGLIHMNEEVAVWNRPLDRVEIQAFYHDFPYDYPTSMAEIEEMKREEEILRGLG